LTEASPNPPARETQKGAGRGALRLLSLAVCVALWQFASTHRLHLGFITFRNIPAPSDAALAGWTLLHSPKLFSHVLNSVYRVFSGYAAAALSGIVLGVAIGRSRLAADLLLPPLELIRPIPAVAWIPLAILAFPSSELSMIFITFTGAIFPILLNTVHGVESVDPRLLASARSLGAGRRALLWEVILPGALPNIVTGLAIGMGTSWFCLVAAEMISGQFGVGYYTWEAYTLQNYPDIVVGMIFIGLLGMASSFGVRAIGARLTPWVRT
jgi:NitT/TauT family transport system permease protein